MENFMKFFIQGEGWEGDKIFYGTNGFCIRNLTHLGRELKKDTQEQTTALFNRLFNISKIFDNISQINNMDETAIY